MSHQQAPPIAPRRPAPRTRFGVTWTDDYAWLRDPAYPEVIDPEIRAYLEAENAISKRSWRRSAAGRPAACRAEGQDQGGRQLGSGPRGRVRVSLAVFRGRPVPNLVPPRPGRGRTRGDPGRDPARGRQGLFQPALARRQPGRPAPGLFDRRGRLRALPAAPAQPRHRRGAGRPRRQHLGLRSSGPRTAGRCSMSSSTTACGRTASAPIAWATTRPATPSSTRRTTRRFSSRSPRPAAAATC